ncbi:hypothetical protein WH47_07840 [Habropoda laboriosa]|uniref:Uncharacterized protein n=1 Tax=Habropoda laboriosa TaxID=597456 RepID=A0A0L7QPC3_9HYME|nr:hypothetical protein WH47_07840 [Habropoda laboriosa]
MENQSEFLHAAVTAGELTQRIEASPLEVSQRRLSSGSALPMPVPRRECTVVGRQKQETKKCFSKKDCPFHFGAKFRVDVSIHVTNALELKPKSGVDLDELVLASVTGKGAGRCPRAELRAKLRASGGQKCPPMPADSAESKIAGKSKAEGFGRAKVPSDARGKS